MSKVATDTEWHASILTLFPEMFPGSLDHSLAGRALEDGIWSYETVNIRDYAADRHKTVDDTPCGGGPGLVMKANVINAAFDQAIQETDDRPVIYLSPRGQKFDQEMAHEFVSKKGVVMLCGRYEGVDERVLRARNVREVSLGDFILSGGEPAALMIMDACIRLLPGVMGNVETADQESFESGLLEYPHYTRPVVWEDHTGKEWTVPDVLLSGHHKNIQSWRFDQAVEITKARRPDLWQRYQQTTNCDK